MRAAVLGIFSFPRWLSGRQRYSCFFLFSILCLALFCVPLGRLWELALHDRGSSHTILIPLLSGFLIYWRRKEIFATPRYCVLRAVPVFLLAAACYGIGQASSLSPSARLTLWITGVVLAWSAGFLLFFGSSSFRAAGFPLLLLLLMIPWPEFITHDVTVTLQHASADMAYYLFKIAGIPVFWQDLKFSLPGVEIEIAEECSGIRSSIALLITSMLVGHLLLESTWKKVCFALCAIPVAILKNALRVVTLSGLGIYVDPGFLHGRLHQYGGLPFSMVAIAILTPVFALLRRGETLAPAQSRYIEPRP
jgi:exosortase